MRYKNFQLDTSLPQALGSGYTSPTLDLTLYFLISIQAVWTSTSALAGTFSLNASNDGVTWTPIPNSSTTISGAGNFMWNIFEPAYSWLQVVFVDASGTGNLTKLTVSGKSV